jgi:DNA replication protein
VQDGDFGMRTLRTWMEKGFLSLPKALFEQFVKLNISAESFLLWIQIYCILLDGDSFPSMQRLAKLTGQSVTQVSEDIASLIENRCLSLQSKKTDSGKLEDIYDPYLLFERLDEIESLEKNTSTSKLGIAKLNQQFQQELGRPLTPIEIEKLYMWLDQDHYSGELIQLALKEAVLANAYNFNYIDRILLTWEGKNIRTKADVLKEQEYRKKQLLQKEIDQKQMQDHFKNQPKVTIEKWL